METCAIPFNATIGNSISPQITSLLLTLFGDNIKIIDVEKFKEKYMFEPCISSRFMVSKGGSCDFTKNGYNIIIHNGTLSRIEGIPQVNTYMSMYP